MLFSLISLPIALCRFLINTAPKRPAPKRPAPKCRGAQKVAPKRRLPSGDPKSHVHVPSTLLSPIANSEMILIGRCSQTTGLLEDTKYCYYANLNGDLSWRCPCTALERNLLVSLEMKRLFAESHRNENYRVIVENIALFEL